LRHISDLGGRRILSKRMSASFSAFREYINEEIAAGRVSAEEAAGFPVEAIEQAVADSLSGNIGNKPTT